MQIDYSRLIHETEADLIALEKQLRGKPTAVRVQMLRLLKSGSAHSLPRCAGMLGYSVRQLSRWWTAYRQSGLAALIETKVRPGKSSQMTPEAWAGLLNEIRTGQIRRLEDARQYLSYTWGINYASVNGVWWMLKRHSIRLK